jgi:hypothetical protein
MAATAVDQEHRVTPRELFFDLVFVFAFTQVATLSPTTRRSPGSAGACSCSAHSGGLDGTPADPASIKTPILSWQPGDTIPLCLRISTICVTARNSGGRVAVERQALPPARPYPNLRDVRARR